MPPAVLYLKHRLVTADRRRLGAVALLAVLHLAAAGLLIWSEDDLAARMAFVLTWGLLNFFWLVLLQRPMTAAALSLALIVILIALSQFKHAVLMMTATFVDVMIIDLATFSFLSPGRSDWRWCWRSPCCWWCGSPIRSGYAGAWLCSAVSAA